jgi:hypothetical protein
MATHKGPYAMANSPVGQLQAARDAVKMHAPPDVLPMAEAAKKYWQPIMHSRAYREWLPAHLITAVQICEVMADVEQMRAETKDLPAGPKKYAAITAIDRLTKRQLALMRSIKLLGDMGVPDKRDTAGTRKLHAEAREARAGQSMQNDDDLDDDVFEVSEPNKDLLA